MRAGRSLASHRRKEYQGEFVYPLSSVKIREARHSTLSATMPNNKKVKSAKKAAKKEALSKENESIPETEPSRLTGAQLAGLVYVSIATSYVLEYSQVVHSGVKTEACAEYILNVDGCSSADLWMIQTKFDSGFLALLLAILTMMVCWRDEPLFLRLNSFLCSSPLMTSLMAVHATREVCHPGKMLRISIMCTVLLVVSAWSLYSAPVIAQPRRLKVNLLEATLLTLVIAFGWETYKLLRTGVPGYLRINPDDVTDPASAVSAFVAVDHATMVGLLLFSLLFLQENAQRVSR